MSRQAGEPEKLSRTDWLLLAEAGALLGLARLAVLTLPFRWVMRACGTHMAESPPELDAADAAQVARVAWAVDTARLFTPWDSNCLAQAITGARMLRRRGVATTTYLGVTAAGPQELGALQELGAHAWLRAGPDVILGDRQLDSFTTVSSFATVGKKEPA
jgi:hypothetical protein